MSVELPAWNVVIAGRWNIAIFTHAPSQLPEIGVGRVFIDMHIKRVAEQMLVPRAHQMTAVKIDIGPVERIHGITDRRQGGEVSGAQKF